MSKPQLIRTTKEGHKLLYWPDTREYEVVVGDKSERFAASHEPTFGPDVEDIQTASDIIDRLDPVAS
jgi:hypothetical protein